MLAYALITLTIVHEMPVRASLLGSGLTSSETANSVTGTLLAVVMP